jgi:hypothetical protein
VEVALAGQGSNVQHKLFHRRFCEEQKQSKMIKVFNKLINTGGLSIC